MPHTEIENAEFVQGSKWKSFHFNLRDFGGLPTTNGHYVRTPEFSCNGHDWYLKVYPGGTEHEDVPEGSVSIFLYCQSDESITTNFKVAIMDKSGKQKRSRQSSIRSLKGWKNFLEHSYILDESKNILD